MAGILKVDKYQDFNGNDIMTSDGSGNLTLNNAALKMTPAFLALATSNQSISNATQTTVNFDTTVFDTDNTFNTSTNAYVVPSGQGGKYYLYACIRKGGTWTSTRCYMSFRKNGSDIVYIENGNNSFQTLPAFTTLDLSASDSIVVQYYHDNGSTQNLDSGSLTEQKVFFGGYKLIGA